MFLLIVWSCETNKVRHVGFYETWDDAYLAWPGGLDLGERLTICDINLTV